MMEPIPEIMDRMEEPNLDIVKKVDLAQSTLEGENSRKNTCCILALYALFYATLLVISRLLLFGALIDSSGSTPEMSGSASRICLWIFLYVGIIFGLAMSMSISRR